MKIIKRGKPYRKHKCSKCKTIYVYHINKDVKWTDLIYCPVCNNFLDMMLFDKKMSSEEYENIKEEMR